MKLRTPLELCLGWLVIATLGCGPAEGTISGTVLVDGQPVSGGVISFVPAEGEGTPVTTSIEGGKYAASMMTGKKFVQISAPYVIGKRKEYEGPDAPLVDITDERLPPRYNSQTELSVEVKSGASTRDWDLKSGKK